MTPPAPRFALPELLEMVAQTCGLEAASALSHAFGGQQIYIPLPRTITEEHPLARALGVDAARKLADALGVGKVIVPFGPFGGALKRRHETMRRMVEAGATKAEVARAFEVHERHVYRVVGNAPEPETLPLFPDA